MSTQLMPRMVVPDKQFSTLVARLRECTTGFCDWPAEQCAQQFQNVCGAAGRMVFYMIQRGKLSPPNLPSWLCEPPCQSEPEPQTRAQFARWWLALICWLEQQGFLQAESAGGVAYHREVYRMWRPNQMFYKYPYLSFHPGLCKQYGPAACQQSIAALEVFAHDERLHPPRLPNATPNEGTPPPREPVSEPEQSTDPARSMRYVGSQDSDVYHSPSCHLVKRIKPHALVSYAHKPDNKRAHKACLGRGRRQPRS